MSLSLKIAGVLLPCQLSGRCGGLLDADPAGCLGRAGCRHRWDPRASCSAGVGVPQAPAARRTSASPACTHTPPLPKRQLPAVLTQGIVKEQHQVWTRA